MNREIEISYKEKPYIINDNLIYNETDFIEQVNDKFGSVLIGNKLTNLGKFVMRYSSGIQTDYIQGDIHVFVYRTNLQEISIYNINTKEFNTNKVIITDLIKEEEPNYDNVLIDVSLITITFSLIYLLYEFLLNI